MKYSNLPLDITDIIKQMKSRGLSITDENKATTFLENVSYFRFAAYLRPMEIDASHNYKSGSTFENAVFLHKNNKYSDFKNTVFKAKKPPFCKLSLTN